jgi:hypothetical protein
MSNIEELTTAVAKPKRRASRARQGGRRTRPAGGRVVGKKRATGAAHWVASLGLVLAIFVCLPLMMTEFVVPAAAFFALVLICYIQSCRT